MQFSPSNPQSCKLFIKKSEILTFHMQKRLDFAVLVKGLFSPAKNLFLSVSLPDQINREPFGPTGQTGAPVKIFSADLIGQFGGLPQREPASQQHLEN